MSEGGTSKLTAAEKARIARNREKALQIRATKIGKLTAQHPYAKEYFIDDNFTNFYLIMFLEFQKCRWRKGDKSSRKQICR